jgi:hypothetical protein
MILEGIMSRKKIFEFVSLLITLVTLCAGLVGCGSVQPLPTPTSAPSATPTMLPTVTALPATATLLPLPTPTPGTPTVLPTSPTPTPTQTSLPLPAEPPKFPLDEYIILFVKDGDLYFQDGENKPIQLTHVGGGRASQDKAILSDDGKKVVFFREGNYGNIYSINTDGSHEQLIVKDRPLAEYTGRYSQFIPNTHVLLFNTYQCEMQGETTLCATGLSSVDTNTAEIKELVKPGKVGLYTTISNFNASPDGKIIAVEYPGYVDILDINGKAIRRNVIPYTPGIPSTTNGLSLLPSTSWLPDSSGLIVVVPDGIQFVAGFDMPAYSVWRYDIDTATATRIPLTPSLVDLPVATCGGYGVSPDGKWILYYGSEDYTRDPLGGTYSLYIGDLRNGQVQRYDMLYCWGGGGWGPDSRYFSYGDRLGIIGKPSIAIRFSQLNRWVDNFHFIFSDNNPKPSETKTVVAEIKGDTVAFFDLGIPFFDLVTIKPKG